MSPHEDPSSEPAKPKKSFGNMGPDHWTQAREDANGEDIACYRERSRAPGVAQGGGSRMSAKTAIWGGVQSGAGRRGHKGKAERARRTAA